MNKLLLKSFFTICAFLIFFSGFCQESKGVSLGTINSGILIGNYNKQYNGLRLNFIDTEDNGYRTNGLDISILHSKIYQVNGIVLSLINNTEKISGLNLGLLNTVKNLNGIGVGLYNKSVLDRCGCKVYTNGVLIGIINRGISVRGVQIGIFNITRYTFTKRHGFLKPMTIHGIQIGAYNKTSKLNGVQIGIFNQTYKGGLQIGLINYRPNNIGIAKILPIINFRMEKKDKDKGKNTLYMDLKEELKEKYEDSRYKPYGN